MKPWLILINDFCHDLFTGLWFGSFVTIWVLQGQVTDAAVLADLNQTFLVLCLSSLVAIMATGVCRFFYYRDWDSPQNAQVKKQLLKIKHALLGSLMVLGSLLVVVWAW